jgi:serine/threonine protein phosphatase 1
MIAVIGDIHGCFYTLKKLVTKIKKEYPNSDIYSLGDLVDRGNFSAEVIEFVKDEGIVFTAGNHDLMFYYFFTDPPNPIGVPWIYNGNENTIRSYEKNPALLDSHLDIIGNAPLYINLDYHFISHAGISEMYLSHFKDSEFFLSDSFDLLIRATLAEPYSIIWNRAELIKLEKTQIVGHTRFEDVIFNKRSNSIYIDTSIDTGNKLTAVIIDGEKLVNIISVPTVAKDLE